MSGHSVKTVSRDNAGSTHSTRVSTHDTAHSQMARKNSKLKKKSSVIFGVKEFMNFPHYLHRLYPSVKDGTHCTLLITGTYNYKLEIHRLEVSNLLKANLIASCTIIYKPVRQAQRHCVSLSVCIWRSALFWSYRLTHETVS
jgi:hypothetical protein